MSTPLCCSIGILAGLHNKMSTKLGGRMGDGSVKHFRVVPDKGVNPGFITKVVIGL